MPDEMSRKARSDVQSFEVAEGDSFGDLLSPGRVETGKRLKIGLLATGFFEYWRMYPSLKGMAEQDAGVVHDRLSEKHDIVYSGLVDTMDAADAAGRRFRDEQVDLVILAYRTYVPDTYMHQMLSHVPGVPLLVFASQSRDKFDYSDDYSGVLRNSGLMALVQLVCGLRKIGSTGHAIESVAGSIHDEEAYRKIDRYIDVVTVYKQLKTMTIGVIGHVFRGMFDFEYDKTKVKGVLGPEVLNIQIDHLMDHWEKAPLDDPDVQAMIRHAHDAYTIEGVGDTDLDNAARVAVALRRVVERFRLDGVALLCQHFIEKKFKTTPNLGLAELHRTGHPGVAEGDVVGLIMMTILHRLTGNMPFFVEWSEFDVERNAWMLLGHGFGDPRQARNKPVKLTPTAEQWGLEGTGCSTCFVPKPGPCTMAHFVHHAEGWRMLVSGGELLDLDPLPINDVHALVKVDRPIREFTELLLKAGVPHHAITVRGDVRHELGQLAELLGMPTIRL
jgi:L-arabinose isomerase